MNPNTSTLRRNTEFYDRNEAQWDKELNTYCVHCKWKKGYHSAIDMCCPEVLPLTSAAEKPRFRYVRVNGIPLSSYLSEEDILNAVKEAKPQPSRVVEVQPNKELGHKRRSNQR